MFKAASAIAFSEAWRALRGDASMPHYRTVFNELPSEFLPRILVIEEAPEEKFVIRFMGTSRAEMWGQELTGKDSLSVMAYPVASAARRNLITMLTHLCGLYHVAHYSMPSGREVMMEHLTVPVANEPGLPRRVINFAEELTTMAFGDEPVGEVRSVVRRVWVDVGAGVPDHQPAN